MSHDLTYREHAPVAALRGYVQCLWEMQGLCHEMTPRLILPDGCMSIVLNFGEPMEQLVAADEAQRRGKTLVIGEVRRPITLQSEGRLELVGVRFWPGAIRRFIDAPVAEVVDAVSDESSLHGVLSRTIVRTVYGADREDRLRLLQAALVQQLASAAAGAELVHAAIHALVVDEGLVKIDELAATFDVSRRSLERRFADEVGIPPKYLANVLRFRRALRSIETGSNDWAEISVDCGYYDQSHLIRDFRRFTGRSPTAYLREGHPFASLRTAPTEPSR